MTQAKSSKKLTCFELSEIVFRHSWDDKLYQSRIQLHHCETYWLPRITHFILFAIFNYLCVVLSQVYSECMLTNSASSLLSCFSPVLFDQLQPHWILCGGCCGMLCCFYSSIIFRSVDGARRLNRDWTGSQSQSSTKWIIIRKKYWLIHAIVFLQTWS